MFPQSSNRPGWCERRTHGTSVPAKDVRWIEMPPPSVPSERDQKGPQADDESDGEVGCESVKGLFTRVLKCHVPLQRVSITQVFRSLTYRYHHPVHDRPQHHSCSRRSIFAAGQRDIPSGKHTKSYWKWPFIVDLPIENGGSFHSYVNVYQRVDLL